MKFWIVKKKSIIAILLCVALISVFCGAYFPIKASTSPKPTYTIVIDAGHGGRDGGAVGVKTGTSESELNLKYALSLKSLCEEFGMRVILTRNDMGGLYDESASNKKRSEMEKRKQIICSSGADVMISIHMNSYPLQSLQGTQIFYAKGSEGGQELAKSIQTSVCKTFDRARKYVSVGDYFVLNCSPMPAVLIECGFLSSPEDEKNLLDKDYRESLCYHILAGIISFFQ